ncbi:GNAT family N-acetyltransferase [Steroidobacter sp. S1-65]|uniref:GNAT family N-acetyltransferase n=1 Tax=Steroidobacter gossypii TaxID=2805490 RepID=A0ABS1WQE1_9GAMM|nr:GNAT family N-acetyltransferase [Steroidobacter gossypii]MBM0103194.1 GNAT family N-acetyltransferase [Steroidobacter gossypii]
MLRLATPADRDAVYSIYMHPEVIPYLGYDPMPAEAFVPIFQELLDCRSFYVFERDGKVAGFIRSSRQPGRAAHVAYLGTFAVSPDWHGTGVARQIMEETIALLKKQGVLRLELQLEPDNPRALAFYTKLGFQQEGRLRAAYKRAGDPHYTDEIYMGLLLADLPTASS